MLFHTLQSPRQLQNAREKLQRKGPPPPPLQGRRHLLPHHTAAPLKGAHAHRPQEARPCVLPVYTHGASQSSTEGSLRSKPLQVTIPERATPMRDPQAPPQDPSSAKSPEPSCAPPSPTSHVSVLSSRAHTSLQRPSAAFPPLPQVPPRPGTLPSPQSHPRVPVSPAQGNASRTTSAR